VKLNLRKGLTFHNGKEFTSDDVKWSIMRVRDPGVGGSAGLTPQSNWWTSIDTPDKNTIEAGGAAPPHPVSGGSMNARRVIDGDVTLVARRKDHWREGFSEPGAVGASGG